MTDETRQKVPEIPDALNPDYAAYIVREMRREGRKTPPIITEPQYCDQFSQSAAEIVQDLRKTSQASTNLGKCQRQLKIN